MSVAGLASKVQQIETLLPNTPEVADAEASDPWN